MRGKSGASKIARSHKLHAICRIGAQGLELAEGFVGIIFVQ